MRRDLELYGITSPPNGFLQRRIDGTASPPQGWDDDGQDVGTGLELAGPGLGSTAQRKLAVHVDSLRNEIACPEGQLAQTIRLQRLLLDAETRLAGVPHLEAWITELERQLADTRADAERAHAQARELDHRLTLGEHVLAAVFSSPSWRLTQPLRTAKHLVCRLRGAVGR